MKGLLIRVGIDSTSGEWNAPVDPETRRFLYIPIPEDQDTRFRESLEGISLERKYSDLIREIKARYQDSDSILEGLDFPSRLNNRSIHLDPDFETLTYGDRGRRANPIREMKPGDFIAFYAGLRSISLADKALVYAIIGIYIIDEILEAELVPEDRWGENAHTRRMEIENEDIIVRARRDVSGRLEKCIPIGEWRDRAYRVKKNILNEWSAATGEDTVIGITTRNGYIQRSGTLPYFKDPERFHNWFLRQDPNLLRRNN